MDLLYLLKVPPIPNVRTHHLPKGKILVFLLHIKILCNNGCTFWRLSYQNAIHRTIILTPSITFPLLELWILMKHILKQEGALADLTDTLFNCHWEKCIVLIGNLSLNPKGSTPLTDHQVAPWGFYCPWESKWERASENQCKFGKIFESEIFPLASTNIFRKSHKFSEFLKAVLMLV